MEISRRHMLFVDGENLTFRAQAVFDSDTQRIADSKVFRRDVFAWFGSEWQSGFIGGTAFPHFREYNAIRSHYYTSSPRDAPQREEIAVALRAIGFDPLVFHRNKQGRSKGVDISLTKDMLSHAFRDNYDVAVLVAGDGDYLPLIDEVKRLGKIVRVAFLTGEKSGLSDQVRLAADSFIDITEHFTAGLKYDPVLKK